MSGRWLRFLMTGWLWSAAAMTLVVPAALMIRLQAEPESLADREAAPIQLFADWSQEWSDDAGHTAIFRGHCRILQGASVYTADKMVVWVRRDTTTAAPMDRLTVYLEDGVETRTESGGQSSPMHVVELTTAQGITLTVRGRQTDTPGQHDELYQRAVQRRKGMRRSELQQTQLTVDPTQWGYQPVQLPGPTSAVRRVRIYQRGALPFSLQSEPSPNTTPPEQIVYISGGVTVLVDGLDGIGVIDLSADRAIIWTQGFSGEGFQLESVQSRETPYEVYLEGNIVIRQGTNVITAERAYYDAREERALIYNAELKAYLPDIDSSVRVRAERVRQLTANSFHAQNAWLSTSQLGQPGYRLQATDVFLEQRPGTLLGDDVAVIDPATGQYVTPLHTWATAVNSTVLIGETPIFYSPYISVPAEDPGIPLSSVTFRQDRIFGTQVRTRWDAFQLFGLERPDDTRWNAELSYLSDRGPLISTDGSYRGVNDSGNLIYGNFLGTYVHDDGRDNLGLGRRDLAVSDPNRGILQWQDRHWLNEFLFLQTELGYASDRNFREQYYEDRFDRGKDLDTLGYLKYQQENLAASLLVQPQINEFENQTQWLPRGDLYFLGEPLANGLLNWSSHTSAAYATLEPAAAPTDPNDLYSPLPYYTSANGLVAMTRHELSMPFNLGPMKLSPYALGEAAFWSDGFTQESIDRFYGRAGVRGSILFWRVFPYVNSDIFNLCGLAHKMLFDFDYGYADSSRDLSEIPQWNEFDDDAQERFRERLLVNTFGGMLPPEFDPRFFAVRTGAGGSVTAPYHELVDDQQALRLGWRHRLQTKVGPPSQQRIKDWMTLDLGVSYFPDAERDNFGEDFGLFTTRYAWHVGDRTSILASSLVDFYDTAENLWSIGVLSQRSVRGSVYLGFRQIEGGPLESQILTASYSYQMSPKWISTASTAFDIGEGENRGQALTVTRVGEWFLMHVGFNFDASKNNVGLQIAVEPRLGNKGIATPQLSSLLNNY